WARYSSSDAGAPALPLAASSTSVIADPLNESLHRFAVRRERTVDRLAGQTARRPVAVAEADDRQDREFAIRGGPARLDPELGAQPAHDVGPAGEFARDAVAHEDHPLADRAAEQPVGAGGDLVRFGRAER